MTAKAPAIGIDLGTSFCRVVVFENAEVKIISNDQVNPTTPSYVAFTDTGRLIGQAAKDQLEMNPENTIFAAKRLIGRMYWDPVVQSNLRKWPFEIICDGKGRPKLCVDYKGESKWLYPEEVVAMTLLDMKRVAEAYLKMDVTAAVISIPVYFNSYQRQAVKNAGIIAGLNVLRVTGEPLLAAFAYGYQQFKIRPPIRQTALILDIGGGSVGVSIVNVDDGMLELKSAEGDPCVGGEDFNHSITTYLVQLFMTMHQKDISTDKRAMLLLRAASEKAKRVLSKLTEAPISIKNLYAGIDFEATLTRTQFEDLNDALFRSVLQPVDKALREAKLNKSDINSIVMLGGCSRIPRIQQLVQEYFNRKHLNSSFDGKEAVACGAAIQAAILSGDETVPDIHLLGQGYYYSLGVDDNGGKMVSLINRMSGLPAKYTQTFTRIPDFTGNISFQIFEGENALTKDNIYLGEISLGGLPSAEADIQLTFEMEENLVLSVTTICAGIENNFVIYCGLKEREMERLTSEAARYKADDDIERDRVLAKEKLVNYCVNVQATLLKEESLLRDVRADVLDNCKFVLDWLESNGRAGKEAFEEKLKSLAATCCIVNTPPFDNEA